MLRLSRIAIRENGYFILLKNVFTEIVYRPNSLKRDGRILLLNPRQSFGSIKLSIFDVYSVNLVRSLCQSKILQKKDSRSNKWYRSPSPDVEDEYDYKNETGVDEDVKEEKGSKLIKTKVNSLRADLVLKAGLGIARNKIETMFYESRVRINGQKIPKKSVQVDISDEIDIIRGVSPANPTFLTVSRVVVLAATPHNDGFIVQLRRFKGLLVENYSGPHAYKSSISNLA